MSEIDCIAEGYFFAKNYVIKKGFAGEIDWQDAQCFENMTERDFLLQYTWVVLASGMSDRMVRKLFPKIQELLFNFDTDRLVIGSKDNYYMKCLSIINHPGKIKAIIDMIFYIKDWSIKHIKDEIGNNGISFIQTFAYMGKATSYHLAKNIGLDVAKPDRHLTRIVALTGHPDVHSFCEELSAAIAERVSLIDLVLWRYATLDKNYEKNISWFVSRKRMIN